MSETEQTPDALMARLHAAVPGATVTEVHGGRPEARFVVMGRNPGAAGRKNSQLAHGSTRSEAIDRVVFLFGRSR